MQTSESVKEIALALAKFQANVGNVTKDSTNPFFKSKYASLESVISTVRPVLASYSLSFSQFPDEDGLTTILLHSSGEWMMSHAKLIIKDQTPQGHGSAITYLRRYALSAVLGIATEDDDDGNAASVAKPPKAEAKAAEPKPAPKPQAPKTIEQQRLAAKKRIKDICDAKALAPLLTSEDYGRYVTENTGLALEPENYIEIINRLEAIK